MDPANDRDSDHADSEGSVVSKDTCEFHYNFKTSLWLYIKYLQHR